MVDLYGRLSTVSKTDMVSWIEGRTDKQYERVKAVFHELSLLASVDVLENVQGKTDLPTAPMTMEEVESFRLRLNKSISELKMLEHFCAQFELPVNMTETFAQKILDLTAQNCAANDPQSILLLALEVLKETNQDLYDRYMVTTDTGANFYFKFKSSASSMICEWKDLLAAKKGGV